MPDANAQSGSPVSMRPSGSNSANPAGSAVPASSNVNPLNFAKPANPASAKSANAGSPGPTNEWGSFLKQAGVANSGAATGAAVGVSNGGNNGAAPKKNEFLPSDEVPKDLSKGEKDKDLFAERPENIVGAKTPEYAHINEYDSASEYVTHDHIKKEVIEGEVVKESNVKDSLPEKGSSGDEFKTGLKDVMQHTGISFKSCLLFPIMLILVGAVIYYFFFYRGHSETSTPTPKEEEKVTEVTEGLNVPAENVPKEEIMNNYGINTSLNYGLYADTPSSLVPSTHFGETLPPSGVFYSGIDTALIFGGIKKYPIIDFVKYISVLKELKNVYNTDIHAMLDVSPSRLSTLENHIKLFEETLANTKTLHAEMILQMGEMKVLYDQVALSKTDIETKFFGSMSGLDPNGSYVNLEQFIIKYKEQVDFKSRYNAMAKLNEYYQNALSRAEARLSDIKANINPLVEGVVVTDIVGSNINLIEPESSDQ